ncbi:HTH-type transcriptional regulator RutR [alpha proteobacterium Q-1]|nr:HTH-type transcriptional regulator RutR [alpha proteobacterium Q-1]
MPLRNPKEQIRRANEAHILQAAEQVFAQYGYRGATMDGIAEAAGVPKANVHYYFANKKRLYQRVMAGVFDAVIEACAAFDRNPEPAEALRDFVVSHMELARNRPDALRVWGMAVASRGQDLPDDVMEPLKAWLADHCQKIEGWITAAKMPMLDPAILFHMIWASTHYHATHDWQISKLSPEASETPMSDRAFIEATEDLVQLVLRGTGLQRL